MHTVLGLTPPLGQPSTWEVALSVRPQRSLMRGAGRGFLSGVRILLVCFAGSPGHRGAQTMPGHKGRDGGGGPESGGKGFPLPVHQLWVLLLPLT